MPMRDLVSWTAMITAYKQAEQPDKALLLFQHMQLHGVLSDSVTIVSVASAVGQLGLIKRAKIVHSNAICNGYLKYLSVGNAIIAMYAKCGNVSLPRLVFDLMEERDVISWNSIISGYSQNGQASEALFLSEVILDSEAYTNPVTKLIHGIKPDHITFTSLLSACGHADLINEGRKCFAEMKKHSVSPRVKHYACMVDMLGRAGLLNQAFDMVQQMPIPKNDGVWGALLLACRIHGDTELTELAARNFEKLAMAFGIMKIDPEMSVQVTNNLRICNDCYSAFKFVSYVYGRKVVVRDAYRFHHFQDGTCSCNDYW
ncbi:hypothetical protein Goshw_015159 [Gossypium schwendimanii]|uniref:DYW domain-containing protein n=1 Tax=Gossypium schwendimanii TaxID=34291 RepID=A0A7J9KLJ9_GOSSC|nr:hypothetical protein [Gossypium schwendimanii]